MYLFFLLSLYSAKIIFFLFHLHIYIFFKTICTHFKKWFFFMSIFLQFFCTFCALDVSMLLCDGTVGAAVPGPSEGLRRPLPFLLPAAHLSTSARVSHAALRSHLQQPAQHGHEVHALRPQVSPNTLAKVTSTHFPTSVGEILWRSDETMVEFLNLK